MNIKDIARRAGVSSATVSRVLNDSGYVKEDTRQKVLRVVDKYHYVPSAIARNLSIQDNPNIGIIIPDIENEFFSKLINGISEIAESFHYNIVLLGTNETPEKEHAFLKTVKSQRLKGVIIAPVLETDTTTREYLVDLEESGIPVVLVDRDVQGARFDGVYVDNQQGAYDGVMELIKAGHERIAIITGPETSKPGKERCMGYRKAMADSGLAVPEDYVAFGDFKIAKAYACTQRLLNLKVPPTAIFTSNNLSTLGCLKYLTEHDLVAGRDLSLMGFDDIDALRMIDYRISVVERDARNQGREAMRLLLECFADAEADRQRGTLITIPYRVILRGSEKMEVRPFAKKRKTV